MKVVPTTFFAFSPSSCPVVRKMAAGFRAGAYRRCGYNMGAVAAGIAGSDGEAAMNRTEADTNDTNGRRQQRVAGLGAA